MNRAIFSIATSVPLIDMLRADPDQIADDVAAVERFLKKEPEKHLAFLFAARCKR
jgi:hypothetical protein